MPPEAVGSLTPAQFWGLVPGGDGSTASDAMAKKTAAIGAAVGRLAEKEPDRKEFVMFGGGKRGEVQDEVNRGGKGS